MEAVKNALFNGGLIKERKKLDSENMIIEKQNGYYYKKTKDKEIQITNFLITIKDIFLYKNIITNESTKSLNLSLKGLGKEASGEFDGGDLVNSKRFATKIKEKSTYFNCYDMNSKMLDSLIMYIHLGVNIKDTLVVSKIGYVAEHDLWAFDNGIIYKKIFYPYTHERITEIPNLKIKITPKISSIPIFCKDDYFNPKIKDYLIEDFRHMFCGKGGDLVLGFLMASLFVNSLKELNPFPILFVSGKKSSGKSKAIEHAVKILGIEKTPKNFEVTSIFSDDSELSGLYSYPLWRDEYKNTKSIENKIGVLKSYYDRAGSVRGHYEKNGDGTYGGINETPINATLLLSGEQTPTDSALFSRLCLIDMKADRGAGGETKYNKIKQRSDYYPSIIKLLLENNEFKDLVKIYGNILNNIKIFLHQKMGLEKRILTVYAPMIAGFFFYNEVILGKNIANNKEWMIENIKDISMLVEKKRKDEEDEDSVNEFFGIILDMHLPDQKGFESLSFFNEYIQIINDEYIQIAYPHLFKKYEAHQIRLRKIPENKLAMKKNILNDYPGSQESSMNAQSYSGRSIRINKNTVKGNLKNLVKSLERYILTNNK